MVLSYVLWMRNIPHIIKLRGEQGLDGLQQNLTQPTVIDLSGIAFASSRLIQSLLKSRDQAIIAAPSEGVLKTLTACGVDKLLQITQTVEEAISRANERINQSVTRFHKAVQSHERTISSIDSAAVQALRTTGSVAIINAGASVARLGSHHSHRSHRPAFATIAANDSGRCDRRGN